LDLKKFMNKAGFYMVQLHQLVEIHKEMRKKSFKSCFDVGNKIRVQNILAKFHHGREEFNRPMRGIKDNGIHRDVPGGLIIM
jgi:hypothetical protein